jgi:hypothetical protein
MPKMAALSRSSLDNMEGREIFFNFFFQKSGDGTQMLGSSTFTHCVRVCVCVCVCVFVCVCVCCISCLLYKLIEIIERAAAASSVADSR